MRRASIAIALVAVLAVSCGGGSGGTTASGSAAAQQTASQKPVEHHPITFAFSAATPQVSKVPSILALEQLKQDGHDVKSLYLQQSEDPVQAVVRGDANFGSASASTVFAAIGQGIPVKAIMVANTPDYVMVAPASVTSPSQLGGLKIGIHAAVSSTALYTNVMLEKFPGVKPNILVVPGSANRVQALAAGQLDGSVIQLSDLPTLDRLAPNKFHVIFDVAKERPDLMDAVIFAKSDLLQSDPNLVQQYIVAQLKANRNAYSDQKGLADAISKYVPNTTADLGTQFAKFYTDSGIWPKDGGMDGANISATLSALTSSKLIDKAPSATACCDRTTLDAALKTVGK